MPTIPQNVPSCPAPSVTGGPSDSRWTPLRAGERWCVLGVGAVIAGLGLYRLLPGILEADNGDFQLACATMGIAHPPGYFGYAFIGWLWTRLLFFVDPACAVQLGCVACVAGSAMVCCTLLVHTGCHALLAAGAALLPVQHPWFWYSITCAEVYAPSLLSLALVVYLVYRYGRQRRAWHIYLAAGIYGFLIVNRPPAAFYAPGIVAAVLLIERRNATPWFWIARRLAGTAAVAALVVFGTLLYGLWRENPTAAYNYVDEYEKTYAGVPADDGSLRAAVDRLAWLVTASEFDDLKGSDAGQTRSKLRWIRRQLFVYDTGPLLMALLAAGMGCVALIRQNADLLVLLLVVVVSGIAFQTQYRAFDFASDLLPVIWSLTVIMGAYLARGVCCRAGKWLVLAMVLGAGLWLAALAAARVDLWDAGRLEPAIWSVLLVLGVYPKQGNPRNAERTPVAATLIALGVGAWVIGYGATRYSFGEARWREPFLKELDFASFPADSVFIADWGLSQPLLYEKLVRHPRPDITVIRNDDRPNWRNYVTDVLHRPLFYTMDQPPPDGYELRPVRNVFEVVKKGVRE